MSDELPTNVFLGVPNEGDVPPHPLLTHWVGFEGGFNAWARVLPNGYLLLCLNQEGEDPFVVDDESDDFWSIGVLRDTDADSMHESEASPLNLATALEALVGIDWKERESL